MTFKEFLKMDEANGHGGKRHNSFTVLRMNYRNPQPVSVKKQTKKLFKI
jgi:hypothetical protein